MTATLTLGDWGLGQGSKQNLKRSLLCSPSPQHEPYLSVMFGFLSFTIMTQMDFGYIVLST